MNKRRMRKTKYREIRLAEPTIRIGKKRATDSLVEEIAKQLDKREVVKVKVLKTALVDEDMEELAQKVAKETDSKVVYLRGHTFALYRPKEI
jgi:RNA-binding protein